MLTSSLGAGHTRAALAIQSALRDQAPDCATEVLDFWSLMDPEVSRSIRDAYLQLVTRNPQLYQRIYQLDQHLWRAMLESGQTPPAPLHELHDLIEPQNGLPAEPHFLLDRILFRCLLQILHPDAPLQRGKFSRLMQQPAIGAAWKLLANRLYRHIQGFEPDALIATQVNMGALAAKLKRDRRIDVPLTAVPTDFGVHDFWSQDHIDCYCIADSSMQAAAAESLPPGARVEVTGIPLLPEFAHLPTAVEARRLLGIAGDRTAILVLGGGLGLCMAELVVCLVTELVARPAGPLIMVLAGKNSGLRTQLASDPAASAALASGALRVHGWTDRVATFMRAADIIVGKPGGLTTAEALACGRPLYSTSSLGGQESFNVTYLQQKGVGELLGTHELCCRIHGLLDDRQALRRLQRRAGEAGRRHGAAAIANHVLALAHCRQRERMGASA